MMNIEKGFIEDWHEERGDARMLADFFLLYLV